MQKTSRHSSSKVLGAAFSLILTALAPSALAVTQTNFFSNSGDHVYDPDISAVDLINSGRPSFGTLASSIPPSVGNLTSFNDGLGQDYSVGVSGLVYWDGTQDFGPGNLSDNPKVTVAFNLNPATGGSATGYDLTNITSIYGWGDHASFNDQYYKIEWAPANNPNAFATLSTVAYGPFDPSLDLGTGQPGSSKVVLTDLGLIGVGALRFTFMPYLYNGTTEQGGQALHEMDVFGTATAPVPEPATIGLAAGGLMLLVCYRRSMRRRA